METENLLTMESEEVQGLDCEDPTFEETIELVSCDEEIFTLFKRASLMSDFVKTIVEGDEDAGKDNPIQVKKVDKKVLEMIVEYLVYHDGKAPKEIQKPIRSVKMDKIVSDWDSQFIDKDTSEVFKIILGANYMDIKPLLHLGCAKIATLIKGKTPDEIKVILGENPAFPAKDEEKTEES